MCYCMCVYSYLLSILHVFYVGFAVNEFLCVSLLFQTTTTQHFSTRPLSVLAVIEHHRKSIRVRHLGVCTPNLGCTHLSPAAISAFISSVQPHSASSWIAWSWEKWAVAVKMKTVASHQAQQRTALTKRVLCLE